jgi:leucyl-tRNA synthetase
MHLLYSRFFTKALFDLGLVDFSVKGGSASGGDEPFTVRKNHGVILGADSQKMSKSRGNVVDPDDLVKKYGADTVRMYLTFMGPYDQGGPWNPGGIMGVYRFLNRMWTMAQVLTEKKQPAGTGAKELKTFLNRTIKKVGGDISNLKFNTAVSELMKLLNEFETSVNSGYKLQTTDYELFLKLLSPFAPHLTEEIWSRFFVSKKSRIRDSQSESGQIPKNYKSIHLEKWPEYDEKLIAEELVSIVVQMNGKARSVILLAADSGEEMVTRAALADEKIKKHLAGREIRKTIFVKNRLINFVI